MNASPDCRETYYSVVAPDEPARLRAQGNIRADVAIVGGGYTGLSAALHVAKMGGHAILLEAARVGHAASGRNGGQLHSGFNQKQSVLEQWLGQDNARGLWRLSEEAKDLVRGLIARHGIACAYHDGVVTAAHSPRAAKTLAAEADHLRRHYGYEKLRVVSRGEANARLGTKAYYGALEDSGGGALNPLAFVRGVARAAEAAGASVFENSRVLEWEAAAHGVTLRTASSSIAAGRLILACDAAMPAIAPELARNLIDIESYLVATAPLSAELRREILSEGGAVADTRRSLDYFRMSDDGRMIFAGGESVLFPARNIDALVRPRMARIFPELSEVQIDYRWSGTVAVTRTRMPHFGHLSERVLFGYGYSGQGLALGLLGGKVLAEAALGRSDDFALLASVPVKPFPGPAMLHKGLAAAMMAGFRISDAL